MRPPDPDFLTFLAGLHRDSLAAGQIHGRFSLQSACLWGLLAEHGHGIPVAFGHFGGLLLLSFCPNENLSDVARFPDLVHTQTCTGTKTKFSFFAHKKDCTIFFSCRTPHGRNLRDSTVLETHSVKNWPTLLLLRRCLCLEEGTKIPKTSMSRIWQ